jgi:hypothetical protein
MATLHCLFLGWWSPRAAFFNIFVLPTNLIASLFVRQPELPSQALSDFVKARLVDSMQSEIVAALSAAQAADATKERPSEEQPAN